MKISPAERSAALAAVGRARQNRHPHVAIRPKPTAGSNAARSPGRLIDPNTRREPAFDNALNQAGQDWPNCSNWEVIGADDLEAGMGAELNNVIGDGMFMQPRMYGAFNAISEDENNEAIGDGPG